MFIAEARITKFDLSLNKGIHMIEIIQRDVILHAIHSIVEHTDAIKIII